MAKKNMTLRLVSSNAALPPATATTTSPARASDSRLTVATTAAQQQAQKAILAFKLEGELTIEQLIREFSRNVGVLKLPQGGNAQVRNVDIYTTLLDAGIIAIESTASC